MVFRGGGFGRERGHEGGAPMNGISALIRRGGKLGGSLPATQGYNEKLAVCKPEVGAPQNPTVLAA